jgi:hypothetical protein
MFTPNGRFKTSNNPPDAQDNGITMCYCGSFISPTSWEPVWNIESILKLFVSIMSSNENDGLGHLRENNEKKREEAKKSRKNILSDPFAKKIIEDNASKITSPAKYYALFVLYSDDLLQIKKSFESTSENIQSSYLTYLEDSHDLDLEIKQQMKLEIYNQWKVKMNSYVQMKTESENNWQFPIKNLPETQKFHFETSSRKVLAFSYEKFKQQLKSMHKDESEQLEIYQTNVTDDFKKEFKKEFTKAYSEKIHKDFKLDFQSNLNAVRVLKIIKHLPLELQYIIACRILNNSSNYMKSYEYLLLEGSLTYFIKESN